MNYDPALDMIVFDHLISETDEPEKKNSYIPDGSYEGFKWKNGQWVHVDKVFDFQLQDGQFPVDMKIRDNQGNIDEKILEEASQKNMEASVKKGKSEAGKKLQQCFFHVDVSKISNNHVYCFKKSE